MHQPIPISILHAANSAGQFGTLRVWVLLKQLNKTYPVVKLNYADLANKTKISHTSLRKHIADIIDYGWATQTDATKIILKSVDSLKSHKNEKCVKIPVE